MAIHIYGAAALIGGDPGAVDALDGAALADQDIMIAVVLGTGVYIYSLDVDSAAEENSPLVIAPDNNGGDKRWLLQKGTFNELIEV